MSTRQRDKAASRRQARQARGPTASLTGLRMSPRKVRLVVDLIRGRNVEDALEVLSFCPKAAALPVHKLLRSAVANADRKGLDQPDRLAVETVYVNEGRTFHRNLPRAMGRATRVRKRSSHVTIVLTELAT